MRYWIFILALFCMILYAQRVSDSKATRNVKYEVAEDSFYIDSVTQQLVTGKTK